jgi:hypothetical protein
MLKRTAMEEKKLYPIELRSEEAQELMGRNTSFLLRHGITVIFTILVILLCASVCIEYPTYSTINMTLLPNVQCEEILMPDNGHLIHNSITRLETTVQKGDTLCIVQTQKDTVSLLAPYAGKIRPTEYSLGKQQLKKGSKLFVLTPFSPSPSYITAIAHIPNAQRSLFKIGDSIKAQKQDSILIFTIQDISNYSCEKGNTLIWMNAKYQHEVWQTERINGTYKETHETVFERYIIKRLKPNLGTNEQAKT